MAVACVAVDLDDTLFLERAYVRSGFEAVGAWAEQALGIPGFAERAWAAFEAGRRGDVFDRVLRAAGVRPTRSVVAELIRRYRAHAPRLSILPDARAALDALRGAVRVAAVTDGPLVAQQAKVAAIGLERWAAPIVYTAELGPGFGKPHPRAFALVERAAGARGPECVYVADNPAKDFAGPAARGWTTVRIRRPGGLHAAAPSGPDVRIEIARLDALPPLLGLGLGLARAGAGAGEAPRS